jgi:hypothetical protein
MEYSFLDREHTRNPKSVFELGYTFFGPLVFNYFKWLIDNLNGADLILFNSREGYFLKDIWETYKDNYNLPNSVYFKTSRKLASMVSFTTETDIYESFKLHRYEGDINDLLFDRFGIRVNIEPQHIDTTKELPNLSKWIDSIITKSNQLRTEYKKYIDNIIGDSKNIIMVDSGFQGTTQYYLEKVYDYKFRGKYFTYKGNLNIKDAEGLYPFYESKFKDNIIFFESVFVDKVGTYIDLINGDFINSDWEINETDFKDKQKIIDGIKQYVKYNIKLPILSPQQIVLGDIMFDKMCQRGYVQNESLFDSFKHDNKFVRNSTKKIIRK